MGDGDVIANVISEHLGDALQRAERLKDRRDAAKRTLIEVRKAATFFKERLDDQAGVEVQPVDGRVLIHLDRISDVDLPRPAPALSYAVEGDGMILEALSGGNRDDERQRFDPTKERAIDRAAEGLKRLLQRVG